MRKIDLHMHTTVSDGTDDPEELISKVSRAGIDLFSITDHDAIRAGEMMPELLTPQMPAFIRGIEFSCRDEKGKYHILGYGYDPAVRDIRDVVEKGRQKRLQKTRQRLRFLQEAFDFAFPQEELFAPAGLKRFLEDVEILNFPLHSLRFDV